MFLKVSLYWKYQLAGWGINGIIHIFSLWNMFDFGRTEILMVVVTIATGLPATHLMRTVVVKFGVTQKALKLQIINFLPITLVFAVLDSFMWLGLISRFDYGFVSEPNFWGRYIQLLNETFYLFLEWNFIYFVYHYVKDVRRKEQERAEMQYKMLELEAFALRAQMNPHFIFNCMNSIKALIQQDKKENAIIYLTTFSKLIRSIFTNSNNRLVSLYEELETCRLYLELEAMRFNGKLDYHFEIPPNVNIKSVLVPALIVQPFIENAIWHGILPKDEGRVNVILKDMDNAIICEVDDDGIGRAVAKGSRSDTQFLHQSKGFHLSQARLNLQKLLNGTNATINIIDKSENGEVTGTKVVITFNLN